MSADSGIVHSPPTQKLIASALQLFSLVAQLRVEALCRVVTLHTTAAIRHQIYRVGQKSKLFILSEYVNKTDKI